LIFLSFYTCILIIIFFSYLHLFLIFFSFFSLHFFWKKYYFFLIFTFWVFIIICLSYLYQCFCFYIFLLTHIIFKLKKNTFEKAYIFIYFSKILFHPLRNHMDLNNKSIIYMQECCKRELVKFLKKNCLKLIFLYFWIVLVWWYQKYYFKIKNIILINYQEKNTLKNNYYNTLKHHYNW
jgi:hypothetical protein